MRTGETALYRVGYKLGYGDEGNFSFPNVPPKANLIYEVALVGFEEAKEVSGICDFNLTRLLFAV